jgi:hypothetical protein
MFAPFLLLICSSSIALDSVTKRVMRTECHLIVKLSGNAGDNLAETFWSAEVKNWHDTIPSPIHYLGLI